MIIVYGASKWRGNQPYFWGGSFGGVFSGSTTITDSYPKIPRLPMFPEQAIERTWLEYFRSIHNIIEDHLADYDMHKVK